MADGPKAVRAIVRGAASRLAIEAERIRVPDPPIGMPRDGIEPGQWGEPPEFPPDCPVQVLGHNGDELYLIDAAGQLAVVSDQQFGQGKVERLFGDRIGYVYWAWPRLTKAKKGERPKVDNFRTEKVRQSLWGEAMRKGLWDQLEAVRGRGVWRGENGQLIVHCGNYLFIDGKIALPGEIDGKLYPRMAPILHPYFEAVDHEPAAALLRILDSFSWARPKTDALLMLGWIGCAMFSGALRVRPSVFVIGDKGRGKSTLQEIIKIFFGAYMLQTADTTPAGIYQKVKQDARPVGIDELEAGADNRRVLAVTQLAKNAYTGALMLRGGSDHHGVEFAMRSAMLMSAINPPPVPPAELSRMGVLSLVRPDKLRSGPPPVIRDDAELASKILKRLMDRWSQFEVLFADYAAALMDGGHEQRGQDTFGTLLAMAHLMLGDEGMDDMGYPLQDKFTHWSHELATASLPEYDEATENWLGCLGHLLTKNLDIWRGGSTLSVGASINAVQMGDKKVSEANHILAQVSMKLLRADEVPGARGMVLAIPHAAPSVAKIFEGSTWAAGPSGTGVWASALRDAPKGVVLQRPDNRVRINMFQFRCSFVDLQAFDEATGGKR